MAESIMRKIQPFTIGTKLSVPSVPKCPDFSETYLPSQTLDNCKLQHNLNDQVSLYLGRSQMHPDRPRFSPVATQVTQAERRQEEMAKEDHLNRNAVSPTAFSRSIRKITISGSTETPGDMTSPASGCPKAPGISMSENINNNNNIPSKPLPRIVGVSCENKPNSHFKVLLKKDVTVGDQRNDCQGASGFDCPGEKTTPSLQTPVLRALSPKQDLQKVETPSCGQADVPPPSDGSFTQRNALFNREILQAEAWIKGKLQDLKDGCNVQRCPLQEWEELSQTLQRDLKDFENTLIQLHQMGEQLICKTNPTSDLVKKQLSQLKDQWHTLKQTAANQSKALGGARSLQEFNRKVDKLEAWIKEKEEEQSLVKVLGENIDKVQLTRRILDLKQDEQLYRTLHEEINHLALKLEKQGKTEGKNISTRRKHVNKMWLRVQSLLKDYHENLQLALEVSSFYQQADNIICAINNKRKSISVTNEQENSGDREIRDIASQIMMLDVTVSQLSNLHPALAVRVTQKQAEVKDGWALLQKAVRAEKPALPASSSDFTREDGDPLTPSREPQCGVGIETHRIMGKEVKEEQNRLKGCVSVRDSGSNRKSTSSQGEDLLLTSHTPPVTGNSPAHAGDVTGRRQTGVESSKQLGQSKPAVPRGHPQLHVQLQKFTVSADKTLSWLKDNVAMATQICCTASLDGFEAAKRCQAALEEEILSNRARIEVVKKEGRSLVRAQHPGSAKIEEFLGQLEVLWEELKRRHQKNVLVLQESEKLNLKAMKVLKDLNSLEAWLQTVELSIHRSSLARDPKSMSAAEQESSLLEREVSSRGLELRMLRQEVDKLRSRRHFHTEQLPARMEEVEEKYHSVQSALSQQSSELQDTRMLTEFLERVELEESQGMRGSRYSGLGQTLHSELGSDHSLLGLQGGGSGGGVPLMESIGDPVEELREAVEMLNDTVRERGRSLSQEQGIQELLSRHSSLTVRITQRLSRSAELSMDILEAETDMAVKCEPDLCGLEGLQDQQDELEVDCEVIKEEVGEMEKLAARLEVLCPVRVQALGAEIQATLQAWEELGRSMAENRARLRQFVQLRDFFRNYLAMISWTEDTRDCIFSESTVLHGTGNEEPKASELDMKIEQKFKEFDDLAAAGQKLMNEEHHLTEMIRERMEELRSMLGWILVRWRAQKHQKTSGKRKPEPKGDVIYSEATVCTPAQQSSSPQSEAQGTGERPVSEDAQRTLANHPTARPGCNDDRQDEPQTEGGYEVMGSVGPRGGDVSSPGGALQGLLAVETPASPFLVLKEPSAPSLGGTVNLILSFGKTGDSQLQVEEPAEEVEVMEPIHRPAESHSSACKTFWRRCQGLLENTFGSLKRKRKIYRQSAEEGPSMSLLSVHMGLEGAGQPPMGLNIPDSDREEQGHTVTTGGHCIATNGRRPEFQSMEGTLERKHRLQLGGKKAPCRAWNSYHAVLFRQTLCFYQDRKDTLKSSVSGLPLNLIGAECSPAPEYTKKANCFSLRLRDDSEYLLSASSRFLMKKWMLKIQANAEFSESDLSRSLPGPCAQEALTTADCRCETKCHCRTGEAVTSPLSGHSQTGTAKAKEIVVLTRDSTQIPQWHHGNLEDLSPALSSDAGHCEDYYSSLRQAMKQRLSQRPQGLPLPASSRQESPSSKRRSHSFTSATYQKITPVPLLPGGREGGSSYSVTLVIGDQLSEATPAGSSSDSARLIGWRQQPFPDMPFERSYASLPRPRNKSVFKKFFGKKD